MKHSKSKKQKYSNYATSIKGVGGLKRIINAMRYSIDGLLAAYSEPAFRQLLPLHSILVVLAVLLPLSLTQTSLLIAVSFFSLIVELINTAIEAAVDHTSLAKNELAKRAKDAGSASQLVTLIMIFILWVLSLIDLLA